MKFWQGILDFQDKFYPYWRTKKPKLLFSNGLAGEVGEVCGVVTHLEGGGTNNRQYSSEQVLHQCADTYVQLVLLVARFGFSEKDFENEMNHVLFDELENRLKQKEKRKK